MKMKKLIKAVALSLCLTMAVPVVAPSVGIETVEAATKVKLNYTKKTIKKGDSIKLKVTGTNKKVKWSSSNKKVATVSSKGSVKGISKGSCKITAAVGGKKYTCKLTVEDGMDYENLAAYGWIAMDEYVNSRYGNNTSVSVGNIYTGSSVNDDTEMVVVYECTWGRQKYYAVAEWIKGRKSSFNGKSLIVRGYEDYSIPSIGGHAFQEKEYFDMYYEIGEPLDYYEIRDLYNQYKKDGNYRFVADDF